MVPHIVLVTDADHLDLTTSDRLYAGALRRAGCTVDVERWDDPTWLERDVDLVVLRSPWDTWQTPERARAFDGFLEHLADRPSDGVANPPPLLRVGEDKANLVALAASGGLEIPDTVLVDDPTAAPAIVAERSWNRGVLKPRFGGSGWGVELVRAATGPVELQRLDSDMVRTDAGWILQEFLPSIGDGEVDVVVIGGRVSHAVRKVPADGEWRTNARFGPRWTVDEAPPAALSAARCVIDALPTVPLYARIDGVMDGDRFVLIEVELVSPSLFLDLYPPAAATFAEATLDLCR